MSKEGLFFYFCVISKKKVNFFFKKMGKSAKRVRGRDRSGSGSGRVVVVAGVGWPVPARAQ